MGKHEKDCKLRAVRELFTDSFEFFSKRKTKFEESKFIQFHFFLLKWKQRNSPQ